MATTIPLQPNKVITVFGNGMIDHAGHRVVLNKRTANTYDRVLALVGKLIPLQGGVRKLYTLPECHLVTGLDELFGHSDFIAVGTASLNKRRLPRLAPGNTRGNRRGGLLGRSVKGARMYGRNKQLQPLSEGPGRDGGDSPPPQTPLSVFPSMSVLPGVGATHMDGGSDVDDGDDRRAKEVLDLAETADKHKSTERERQRRAHQQRFSIRQKTRQNNQNNKVDQVAKNANAVDSRIAEERQRQMQAFKHKMEKRSGTLVSKNPAPSPVKHDAQGSRRVDAEGAAAVVVQAAWRGYSTRKHLRTGGGVSAHKPSSPPAKRHARKKGAGRSKTKQVPSKPSRRRRKVPVADTAAAPDMSGTQRRNRMTDNEAATVIQSTWRGHKQRTKAHPGPISAAPSANNPRALLRLQRIPTPDLSVTADERAEVEHSAATTIQRTFRGHRTRNALQQKGIRVKPAAIAFDADNRGPAMSQGQRQGNTQGQRQGNTSKTSAARKKPTKAASKTRPAASSPSPLSAQQSFSGTTSKVALERQGSRFSTRGIEDKQVVEDQYIIGKTIGDGNFAVVKECVSRDTNETLALKIIDKKKTIGAKETKMIENEVKTMRAIKHANCVALYDVIDTEEHLYLVMELVTGGDLFDRIIQKGRYPEAEAAGIVSNMATALAHMHQRNLIHRDLKPENLLVVRDASGKDTVKLADFGLAMTVTEPLRTVCGTPTYVAPEIISEVPEGYSFEVDMWATGVIAYIVLCGFPPFASASKSQKELFRKIRSGKFSFPDPYWSNISADAKDLIGKLLVVDPKERYSAQQVLKHPWIVEHAGVVLSDS